MAVLLREGTYQYTRKSGGDDQEEYQYHEQQRHRVGTELLQNKQFRDEDGEHRRADYRQTADDETPRSKRLVEQGVLHLLEFVSVVLLVQYARGEEEQRFYQSVGDDMKQYPENHQRRTEADPHQDKTHVFDTGECDQLFDVRPRQHTEGRQGDADYAEDYK